MAWQGNRWSESFQPPCHLPQKRRLVRRRCQLSRSVVVLALLQVIGRPVLGNTPGAALLFDGVNDYATVLPGFRLLTDWTIEAWVQPLEPVADKCLFSVQTASVNNLLKLKSSAGAAWQVLYGFDEQPIPFQGWVGEGKSHGDYLAGPHHVALTHQVINQVQSQLQLYLNSTLRAKWFVDTAAVHANREMTLPALLGACHERGRGSAEGDGLGVFRTRFYRGFVDEVRLWSSIRTSADITKTWLWTGPSSGWPSISGTEYSTLRTQYCFDVLVSRLYDSSGSNEQGWLGTVGCAGDAPRYVRSPFESAPQGRLSLGSIFLNYREGSSVTVDLLAYVFSTGVKFNALRIVAAPSQENGGPKLYIPGNASALGDNSLVPGTSLRIVTDQRADYYYFSVQPCTGLEGMPPAMSGCTGQRVFDVSLRVEASTAPVVGPVNAIQLLREGAFVRLPVLMRPTVTLEFWVQLTSPLNVGATLLSTRERQGQGGVAREIVRLWLNPPAGGAVLDVCTTDPAPASFWLPGVAVTEAQHLAISFVRVPGSGGAWSYDIRVHRNCVLLLNATVANPCLSLDSPQIWPLTLGQRYVPDEAGAIGDAQPWSKNFAAMYVSELRIFRYFRQREYICWFLRSRLPGAEPGLDAYMPVTSADAVAAAPPNVKSLTLSTGRVARDSVLANLAARPEAGAQVECSIDYMECRSFDMGVGFVIRPSSFDLPPEEVTLATTALDFLEVDLVGHDPDNYNDHVLAPSTKDTITYEILEVPSPLCGYIYGKGDRLRILEAESRARFGLPPTTVVPAASLPLSFRPFEGTTVTQVEAMGGACSAQLRYRAIDTQGLASKHEALIRIHIFRPGPTLIRVNATDPGGTGYGLEVVGGLLRFDFSGPTNEPKFEVQDLFEVVNGSWGTHSSFRLTWVENGSSLLVEIGAGGVSQGLHLLPGLTQFRVRKSAGLQNMGDYLSMPCDNLSPDLVGGFDQASCAPGMVLDFATGSCLACSPGDHWEAAALPVAGFPRVVARCVPCPAGTYEWRSAVVSCLPCPKGTYLPPNSTNRTACIPAPIGTYVPKERGTSPEPCIDGSLTEEFGQDSCRVCPLNADCRTKSYATALPEYVRLADGDFQKCRVPDTCVGANQCRKGTEDSSLGCYPCSAGYTRGLGSLRDSGDCVQCPADGEALGRVIAVIMGTTAFALMLASANILAARRSACLHPFMLKIGLSHLLMMSTLSVLEDWHLEEGFGSQASVVHQVILITTGWDGAMPLHLVPLDCLLKRHFADMASRTRLWVLLGTWALLPLVYVVFNLVLCFLILVLLRPIGCLCGKWSHESHDDSEDITMSGILPYETVSERDGRLALPRREWQMCWSPEHRAYYYYDKMTRTSQWEPPKRQSVLSTGSAVSAVASAPSYKRGPKEKLAALEERVLGIWRETSFELSWRERWKNFAEDSSGVVLSSLMLVYPAVLKQVMTFLRCDSLVGSIESSRLLMAPELKCADITDIMVVAWAVLFLWGIGFPVICMLLVYPHRRRLGRFNTKVKIGVLAAEYELRYYYWESLVLLRRFGAVAAATLAPGASPTLRLSLLVAIGTLAMVVQVSAEPFDNRCGLLLDHVETDGLMLFCIAATILLVSVHGLLHPVLAILLVSGFVALHFLHLARIALLVVIQVQRSIAESVVESHLTGKASLRPRCFGFGWRALTRWISERIFMFEIGIRQHRALVRFDEQKNTMVIEPGQGQKPVTDQEQKFVAHGIADCVAHAVADCYVERLSVHLLEYLARQAFLNEADKLRITDEVRQELAWKLGFEPRPQDDDDEGDRSPRRFSSQALMGKGRLAEQLFRPQVFAFGMPASDFQGSLITISLYTKERLEYSFKEFMIHKGYELDDDDLNARDRLLKKATALRNQMKALSEGTPSVVPSRAPMTAATTSAGPLALEDQEDVQVEDLEAPASEKMRAAPLKTSEGSLALFLAGDAGVRSGAKLMERDTPDLPQPEKVCHCRRGHKLIFVGPSESGWICDAGEDLGGCRCGISDFYQSAGLNRFECRLCNYDVCEQCHAVLLKQQETDEDSWTPSQLPGALPEDEEINHEVQADQYHPQFVVVTDPQAQTGEMAASSETTAKSKPTSLLRSKTSVAPKHAGSTGAGDAAPVKKLRTAGTVHLSQGSPARSPSAQQTPPTSR